MRKIAELVKEIKEEISDADKYYHEALTTNDSYEKETYKWLANQELIHVDKLHDLVTRKIAEQKATGITIPEGMMLVWNYEHEEIVRDVDELKARLNKL